MKTIQHAKVWPLVIATLFTPSVFAHSPAEIGDGFLNGLIHQLSSWHHLAGLLAVVVAAGYLLVVRPRKKPRTQRTRKHP